MVQAQESPEPVYDLADCGLKSVPSGVYARCRISRKQALLLQVSSLSQVQDILLESLLLQFILHRQVENI